MRPRAIRPLAWRREYWQISGAGANGCVDIWGAMALVHRRPAALGVFGPWFVYGDRLCAL